MLVHGRGSEGVPPVAHQESKASGRSEEGVNVGRSGHEPFRADGVANADGERGCVFATSGHFTSSARCRGDVDQPCHRDVGVAEVSDDGSEVSVATETTTPRSAPRPRSSMDRSASFWSPHGYGAHAGRGNEPRGGELVLQNSCGRAELVSARLRHLPRAR